MKILVTGGTGMLGSAFNHVKTDHELILVGSKDYDLRAPDQVESMVNSLKPDGIIHLAAKVGGVKGNTDYMSDFFYDNILINTNLLNSARIAKIERVVSLLSTCVYPDKPTYPLTENQIHNGEPHKSISGYAYAKRMIEVQSRAIRQQYGLKYTTAVPNNIYGEFDNFDLENGHVIPAIIRKVWEAKLENKTPIFWGSGKPMREFTYSKDVARALLSVLESYDDALPINIGCTGEVTIREVVRKVCKILNYKKEVSWDTSKPEGQYRKPSCNKKFLKTYTGFEYTDLDQGLEKTCKWFEKNYPNIRGI
jgi:GDP-L-fucose synthase